MPGLTELILLLLIVVLIFGASKLPQLGEALGRTVKNFKRSQAAKDEIEVSEVERKDLAQGDPPRDDKEPS